jgi:phosphoribulokinase
VTSQNKKSLKPFLIGIAGDSASGKSTFAESIVSLFGEKNVLSISLDDYHTYDRAERDRLGITPLNPDANDLKLANEQIKSLKEGNKILKPVYDHSKGQFGKPVWTEPREIVIIEGLHTLYRKKTRDLFNITIFMDPDYEIKREWKLNRDVKKRGHREEDVIKEMERRLPDYRKYIAPQRNKAEILIQIKRDKRRNNYRKGTPYWIRIYQQITNEKLSDVYLPLKLSSMCEQNAEELYFEYRKSQREKRNYSIIEFNGVIRREALKDVEEKIKEVAGRRGQILRNNFISEIELGKMIVTWRVAERYRNFTEMRWV